MGPIWVTFEDGSGACAEIPKGTKQNEITAFVNALEATKGRKLSSWAMLPYPANPRLNPEDHFTSDGRNIGPCPSFCYSPKTCRGKSCCPKAPSCVD